MEFLTSYIEKILKEHEDRDFIQLMSIYLAKMALHHEGFCTKKSSMIGASSIYVALKICEQMR
jgi:dihydroorotase